MTVTTTANSIRYAGNGTTTAFAFPYIFFEPTDLLVTLVNTATNSNAFPDPILNGTDTYDYTVTGVVTDGEYASGATVTFNTAPPTGYTVVLVRSVPATQEVTLIDNAKFPAATVNTEFDKLTVLAQQSNTLATLALHIPSYETDLNTEALPANQRQDRVLAWQPATGALSQSNISLSQIETVILNGGGSSSEVASVATIAALRALTDRPLFVAVLGYWAVGDCSARSYFWRAGDARADNGGTLIRPPVGVPGVYELLNDGPLHATWWGASGSQTPAINLAAIQGAIDWQEAAGGGVVYIPSHASKYQVSGTIQEKQRVFVVGDGPRLTDIQGTANVPVFQRSGDSVTALNGGGIRDVGIWGTWLAASPGANTGSIGIDCHYGHRCVYAGVHFFGCYIGYRAEFCYGVELNLVKAPSGVTGEQCFHGFYFLSCTDANNNNAHECVDCTAYACYNSGWRLLGFSGTTFTSCRGEACGAGGALGSGWELGKPAAGSPVENGHFTNCLGDGNWSSNWLIHKGAGSRVEQLQFDGCQSGGAGANGWWFEGVTKSTMIGCVAFRSFENALRLQNSPIVVINLVADEYNFGDTLGFSGINLDSTNGAVIIGCELTTTTLGGGGRSLDENGTSDFNVVIGNKLPHGCLPNANSAYLSNTGFITENSGSGVIPSGAFNVTVAHGLSRIPLAGEIRVSFTIGPTNDPGDTWVDLIDTTSFRVAVRNNPGATGLSFGWSIVSAR